MADFNPAHLVPAPAPVPPPFAQLVNSNVDAAGNVIADSPCRKCGYNLRGLTMSGRCPECGTPVELSIQGDLLRFSDPAWVRSLRLGTYIVFAAVLLSIGHYIIRYGPVLVRQPRPMAWITWVWTLSIGTSILYLVGTWLLTAPDPSRRGEDRYGYLRKIIRVTLLIDACFIAVNIITSLANRAAPMTHAIVIFGLFVGVANIIGEFARFAYLAHVALRIPDAGLARRARWLMYRLGITYAIYNIWGQAFGMIVIFLGPRSMSFGIVVKAYEPIIIILGIALLLFTIFYLVFLWNFARQLNRQGHEGAALWNDSREAALPVL